MRDLDIQEEPPLSFGENDCTTCVHHAEVEAEEKFVVFSETVVEDAQHYLAESPCEVLRYCHVSDAALRFVQSVSDRR